MPTPRTTLLLLALSGALLLTGCDSGQDQQARSPSEQSAEEAQSDAGQPESEGAGAPASGTSAGTPDSGDQPGGTAAQPDGATDQAGGSDQGGDKVAAGKKAAQQLGCTACHAAKQQLVGPSYQAVAKRYGSRSKILERMKKAVNKGASGNWTDVTGGTPMPPQGQAQGKTEKLKAMADWIAGLGS